MPVFEKSRYKINPTTTGGKLIIEFIIRRVAFLPTNLFNTKKEVIIIAIIDERIAADIETNSDNKIISYNFISNSIINDQFVLLFEEDQKLNFFKNNIIRKFDIYRKTLDPIEVKKDIYRFNNLSEKELYYYQIWGYPYYFECSTHHIPIIKNKKINFFENNFTQVQYKSLKLLKQNFKNDEYIELISIS